VSLALKPAKNQMIALILPCVDISSNWDLLIATATQVKAHNAFSWRKYKRFYLGESKEVDG
jgi:hypothetical protein